MGGEVIWFAWLEDFYVENSTVRYHEVWSRTLKASNICVH